MHGNNENIIVPQYTGAVPQVRSEGLNVTQGKHFVCIHSDKKRNDIASLLRILSAAHVAHYASQALLQRLNSKFPCL